MASYVPLRLQQQVREDAGQRCGYCLSSEAITGIPLEIEHLIPESLGGSTTRENLWLACHRCNKFKGNRIEVPDPITRAMAPLFNPRRQTWHEHFRWIEDGASIMGSATLGSARWTEWGGR